MFNALTLPACLWSFFMEWLLDLQWSLKRSSIKIQLFQDALDDTYLIYFLDLQLVHLWFWDDKNHFSWSNHQLCLSLVFVDPFRISFGDVSQGHPFGVPWATWHICRAASNQARRVEQFLAHGAIHRPPIFLMPRQDSGDIHDFWVRAEGPA